MMLRTHLAFGFLIGMLSLNYLNVPNIYLFLGIVCISSILADVDSSKSRIGKKIKTLSWTIEKTFGHRNIFHSIFPLVAIIILFFFYLKWNVVGMAMIIGYSSHLFIDCFTRMGIGFLHPISKKRITGFMKTGGLLEHLLFVMIVVLDLVYLGWYF